jgi:hypothetical protein
MLIVSDGEHVDDGYALNDQTKLSDVLHTII